MRSQPHDQRQLHKRPPSASSWSVGSSASGIEAGERCAGNEANKGKEKSGSYTAASGNTGSAGATAKRNRENSPSGKRTRRRRLCPHAWSTSSSCFECFAGASASNRHAGRAPAVLVSFCVSAAAALVVFLLLFGEDGIAATGSNNNYSKNNPPSRSGSRGEVLLEGSPGRPESGSGLAEEPVRTGARVAGRKWGGREDGASVTRFRGAKGGIGATGQAGSGEGGVGETSEKDAMPAWQDAPTVAERGGKQTEHLPPLVNGGSSGDKAKREGEGGSSDGRASASVGGGGWALGGEGGDEGKALPAATKEKGGGSSGDGPNGEEDEVTAVPGIDPIAWLGVSNTKGREDVAITTNSNGEIWMYFGASAGVTSGNAKLVAAASSYPDLDVLNTRPPVLSGSVKTCDGYLKGYGVVPGDSWGTAPKRVQDDWIKLNCDQVLGMSGFNLDDPPSGGRQRAIVVVWNEIGGWLEYLRPTFVSGAIETCGTECIFTNDRSLLTRADGVFFHAPTFKMRDAFPKVKPPGVDYVFANLEPTTYRPVESLLRNKQVMSQFDLKMTYERDSDVPLGYVGSSSTARYFKAPKIAFQEKDGFGTPDAIAAFVSNCKAAGATNRVKYMEELMHHVTVHSFGYCLHNREEPKLVPGEGAISRLENKVVLLSRYKFFLAFENNNQLKDYVTEKVYNGLQSGTLPVYWGAENIEDFVPKGSVVKASDFSSPAELGKHLKMLATNEQAYEEYFRWRNDPEEEKRFEQNVIARSAYGVNAMCRLCDRVVNNKGNGGPKDV